MKVLRRVSLTNAAYVSLLLSFVALGTFVYALATGSALAGIIGAALVVFMVAAFVGFRIGARKRAESNDSGIHIEGANVWARPLRRQQIERYLLTYRGEQNDAEESRPLAVVAGDPAPGLERRAA